MRMTAMLGYARVSTIGQDPDAQLAALDVGTVASCSVGERLRRRSAAPVNAVAADTDTPATPDGSGSMGIAADERLAQMSLAQGVLIGCAQILAARRFRRNFLRHLALLEHSMRNGHHQLPRPGGMTRLDPVG